MIEASGWKGRSGTAFSSIGHDQFFRDICAYFRERGRLQLLVLRAGDRPLAVKCNFRAGDGLFAFKIGFDEDPLALLAGGATRACDDHAISRGDHARMDRLVRGTDESDDQPALAGSPHDRDRRLHRRDPRRRHAPVADRRSAGQGTRPRPAAPVSGAGRSAAER